MGRFLNLQSYLQGFTMSDDIVTQLQNEIEECNNDFHALKEMFDKMRADRDRWRKIADSMVTCLNHSIAATDAWEAYEDAVNDE